MKIRNAAINDLAAIAAVEAECFPKAEAADEQSFEKRLSVYPDHFWLLEDEDRIVAFVNGMTTDLPDLTVRRNGAVDLVCQVLRLLLGGAQLG